MDVHQALYGVKESVPEKQDPFDIQGPIILFHEIFECA